MGGSFHVLCLFVCLGLVLHGLVVAFVWGVVSLVYVGFFVVDYWQFAAFCVVMYNGIACCGVVWFDSC